MRKILILIVLGVFLFPTAVFAQEVGNEEILRSSGIDTLQQYMDKIDEDLQAYLGSSDVIQIIKNIASGEMPLTPQNLISAIFKVLFKELALNMGLLGQLLVLAVMAAVLNQMIDAFSNPSVGRLAHSVVFLALITLAVVSFTVSVNAGRETVNEMVDFLKALLPVLVTLTAAEGGVLTAGMLNPLIILFLTMIGIILQSIVFPLIYLYSVLMIINRISPQFKVGRLAGLLKDGVMIVLGFSLTIFVGFLGLQGIAGAVGDSLGMKAAKFAAGTFIPIVGKPLADAVGVITGTAVVMKNAVGIFGVIILFLLWLHPALKILLTGLIYKLAAALVEPFGDTAIGGALEDMGKSILLSFGVVISAGVMFFFTLAVIVGVGNINVMMR